MPIPIPVSRTKIATVPWGIPITNQVNTNTTDIATLKGYPGAWQTMTLQNGWAQFGGRPPCRCRFIAPDIVLFQFGIANGSDGTVFTTLPVGYRPAYSYDFLVRMGGTGVFWGLINVNGSSGTCNVYKGSNTEFGLVSGSVVFSVT